jgi:SAM-dependent MidA family methyltransferase
VGYVSQAQFLLNCGVLQQLAALAPNSPAYWRASSQINTLLSPAEMGDLFKVIAFDKQVAINDYVGFQQGEQSFRL